MRQAQLVVSTLLLFSLLVACTPQTTAPTAPVSPQAPAPAAAPAASAVPAAQVQPAWQQEWEKTLTSAKREGKVIINTSGGTATRGALSQVADMQGLKAEVVSMRTEEFLTRVLAERRAGLYLTDVYVGGSSASMSRPEATGLLEPMEGAFILPDVTDPQMIKKIWYTGDFSYNNNRRNQLMMTLTARTPIVINTNLVKEGEVKSWRDVLNPKWKGNVIVGDPTVAGAGSLAIAAIDAIMGWDYVKELASTSPLVLRDLRQQLEWVAHGKAAMVVGPQPEQVSTFLKLGGLPIKAISPEEGSWVSSGSSALCWISKPANPNASKVYINTLLSKEGQTIFSKAIGLQSTRLDVTTEHLRPEDIRKEGGKYVKAYGEDFLARREFTDKAAKEVFGALVMK